MSGFVYVGGVHVLGTSIWCDAAHARGTSFLSRAEVSLGRMRKDARLVSSQRTASMRRALGWTGDDALVPRFGRPFALGRARLELLPAGGVPGASQLLVELGGWRGLYAGELSTCVGGEALQVRACNELVIEAPEIGVLDDASALDAAVEAGEPLVFENLLAFFGLVDRLGRERLALPPRWSRVAGRSATKRRKDLVRLMPWRPGISAGRVVRAGLRAPDDDAIALGLGLPVAALVRFVADCGATRVHVRCAGEPLRAAGARALISALRGHAKPIDASLLVPPEQMSLL